MTISNKQTICNHSKTIKPVPLPYFFKNNENNQRIMHMENQIKTWGQTIKSSVLFFPCKIDTKSLPSICFKLKNTQVKQLFIKEIERILDEENRSPDWTKRCKAYENTVSLTYEESLYIFKFPYERSGKPVVYYSYSKNEDQPRIYTLPKVPLKITSQKQYSDYMDALFIYPSKEPNYERLDKPKIH